MSNNLLDVISYEGDKSTLVYKHPTTNFNTKSQLIVRENQEALFFKDGAFIGKFGAGRHSLNTDNVPFLKRIFSGIFGGNNPFQCEIVFVDKSTTLDIRWGTLEPVPTFDPVLKLPLDIRSNGEVGFRIEDAAKFVISVVGLMQDCTMEAIRKQVKSNLIEIVTDQIATTINQVGFYNFSSNKSSLSKEIHGRLEKVSLEKLGVSITNFTITDIKAGENDLTAFKEKYRGLQTASGEAEAMTIRASGGADAKRLVGTADIDLEEARMQRLGYSFQEKERFDILKSAAQNEGAAGAMMSTSMGLGMGFGVGGEVGRMANQAIAQNTASVACPNCGALAVQGAKFCSSCGYSLVPKAPHCISCGAELAPGSKFCSNCGASQTPIQKVCSACNTKLDANARFCPVCGSKAD